MELFYIFGGIAKETWHIQLYQRDSLLRDLKNQTPSGLGKRDWHKIAFLFSCEIGEFLLLYIQE
jgi:hypothetical protein